MIERVRERKSEYLELSLWLFVHLQFFTSRMAMRGCIIALGVFGTVIPTGVLISTAQYCRFHTNNSAYILYYYILNNEIDCFEELHKTLKQYLKKISFLIEYFNSKGWSFSSTATKDSIKNILKTRYRYLFHNLCYEDNIFFNLKIK